jgi:hypothetical protein
VIIKRRKYYYIGLECYLGYIKTIQGYGEIFRRYYYNNVALIELEERINKKEK